MFNIFSKFIFCRKKPKVIVAAGKTSEFTKSVILFVLKNFFKVAVLQNKTPRLKQLKENQVLLFDLLTFSTGVENVHFWLKNSSLPILVISELGEIPSINSGAEYIKNLAKILPPFGYLLLNFDEKTLRKIDDKINVHCLTFGFDEGAAFRATDCHFAEDGVNFKLNFRGNLLPIWLTGPCENKNIYAALAVLCLAQVLNLNLVKVSQILRSFPQKSS